MSGIFQQARSFTQQDRYFGGDPDRQGKSDPASAIGTEAGGPMTHQINDDMISPAMTGNAIPIPTTAKA